MGKSVLISNVERISAGEVESRGENEDWPALSIKTLMDVMA